MTKKEKSRMKILHAAKVLLERNGIGNVTFDQIADQADMCRTTIFNHFSSTSDLLFAIYSDELEDLKKVCATSGAEGITLIRLLFDKLIEDTVNYPGLTLQLISNAVLRGPGGNPIKEIEKLVEDNLKAAGYEDAEHLTVHITGSYYGLLNHYLINGYEFSIENITDDLNGMINRILEVE